MAWNKPSETKVEAKGGGGQRKVYLKGILVGAVAVLVGVVCIFTFSNGEADSRPIRKDKSPARIKEVTPAPATTTKATPAKKRYADMTNDEKLQYYVDKYGDNIPPNLAPIVYNLRHPPQGTLHPNKSKYDIFTHRCEREIGSLMNAKPGTFFAQRLEFGERFDKDFTASMMEKIEIKDTDTEEQRKMKEDVITAKKELLAILKEEGRKPSAVMQETADALYELGQYRESLRAEIAAMRRDGNSTPEDLSDLVTAANKMLEAKGAAPIKLPTLAYRLSRQKQSTEMKGNHR